MTLDQYHALLARYRRIRGRRLIAAMGGLFGAMIVANLLPAWNNSLSEMWGPVIIFGVGFPLLLLGYYRADRTYRQFPELLCPHCQGNLTQSPPVITATGNCPHCGRRVLSDSSIGT